MNTSPFRLAARGIAPAAILLCASCSTPPPPDKHSSVPSYAEGVPGGVTVDTYETTAAVTAVDHATRQVTLVTADGKTTQYKAGLEVANFDQVKVGDHVKATVTEQLVVYVREKSGRRNNDGQSGIISFASEGGKPETLTVGTVEVTTRVKSVDLERHKVTLAFPDGTTKTAAVRPDVKLSPTDVGREVVIRVTQSVVVRVEKP